MKTLKLSNKMERVVDVLGEIVGFLTVGLIAFMFINAKFHFISDVNVLNVLTHLREYAILACVALLGLEFSIDKGIIVFIIFAALIATCVVFMFFPGVVGFVA